MPRELVNNSAQQRDAREDGWTNEESGREEGTIRDDVDESESCGAATWDWSWWWRRQGA